RRGLRPFVCAGTGRILLGLSVMGMVWKYAALCISRLFCVQTALRRLLQGKGGIFMSKILLSANHIVQYFGERKILEFEKLNVYEGDHIGIVGGNGVGKTTLL